MKIAPKKNLGQNFLIDENVINQIIDMQRKKTGKLFNFCLQSTVIIAKKNKKEKNFFGKLGEEIGLLFQLADDILDIKGSKKLVDKPIKKDKKKGKSTLIHLLGYKNAINYADKLQKKILLKLKKHGKNADELKKTVRFILERSF